MESMNFHRACACFLGETQVMHENVYFENKELFPANWNRASDRYKYGPTRMARHLSIQRMENWD